MDKEHTYHQTLAVAVAAGIESAAKLDVIVDLPDDNLSLMATICRLRYIEQSLLLGARDMTGLPLSSLRDLADDCEIALTLQRALGGSLTKDDAHSLLSSDVLRKRAAVSLCRAAEKASGKINGGDIKQALVDLRVGFEVYNKLKER